MFQYITVYGTPSSTSSPGNFTSAPYGWNSSVTSSWLLTGTSVTTTTSQPYFPISNSTTSTAPFGTDGTGSPTFVNLTSSVSTTTVLVPTNFTSFPNISTPDVTPTPIPTSSVGIPGNFTTFANITSTPEFSILPIPTSSFANVSSVPASTTAEEPTSSGGPTVTSIIIPPTETTVIVPGESSTATITSLVIDPTETPIEVATSSSTSTSPTLVIVTTLTPIATASSTPSEFPTTVVTATDTVSSNAPTGTPSPQTIHCGIRGTAIGVYYLATYAYNRANVPVTLQGCYQFCAVSVQETPRLRPNNTPSFLPPRCANMSVCEPDRRRAVLQLRVLPGARPGVPQVQAVRRPRGVRGLVHRPLPALPVVRRGVRRPNQVRHMRRGRRSAAAEGRVVMVRAWNPPCFSFFLPSLMSLILSLLHTHF
ncbi:hypothetical protein SLS64_004322 [Diaporthe eres]